MHYVNKGPHKYRNIYMRFASLVEAFRVGTFNLI